MMTNIRVMMRIAKHVIIRVWRQRAFWIIQGLLSSLTLLYTALVWLNSPWGMSTSSTPPGLGTLPLYWLVLPILAAPVILDDLGRIGEILWSGPLNSLAHFAGTFTGLWAVLVSGGLIQLGVWYLVNLLWSNLLPAWSWLVSLAITLLAVTVGLSLTFLLAILVRRTLLLLLIWAVLWISLYFKDVLFIEGFGDGFIPLHEFAFTNIFLRNLSLSPSLGLGLFQDQVVGIFVWFLGLSILAISLALVLAHIVDSRRAMRRKWIFPVFLGAAALTLGAGCLLNGRAISAHAVQPSPFSIQLNVWEVLSQDTEVSVKLDDGTLSGSATLQLSPSSMLIAPEVVLRLNAGLTLTSALDENGSELPVSRVGDSVVIGLTEVPESPLTLSLAWQGTLFIPYTAYGQTWEYPDAPYPAGFAYAPAPLKALIHPVGGYLLRDGDWMPWPWSSWPHQARENRLVIRPEASEVVASSPIQNGAVAWEGRLPEGLLAFLPDYRMDVGGSVVAASPLVGELHLQQAVSFAETASELAALFDVTAPRFIIVAPYLSKLVWSGDLLLVPDGGGYYISEPVWRLFKQDTVSQEPALARATMAALAREFLLDQVSPARLEYIRLLAPRRIPENGTVTETEWKAEGGHWVQAAETFDVITTYDPRRYMDLSAQGEWHLVAFWLAMEMADETVRQADLELLAYFLGEGKPERYFTNEDYEQAAKLIWPGVLEVEEGRDLIWQLHQWTESVGRQEALSILAAAIKETQPETVEELVADLEQRSDEPILEGKP